MSRRRNPDEPSSPASEVTAQDSGSDEQEELVECEHCSESVPEDQLKDVTVENHRSSRRAEEQWCTACRESDAVICEGGCDELVASSDTRSVYGKNGRTTYQWCPVCADEGTSSCESCDDLYDSDDINAYEVDGNSESLCEGCAEEITRCDHCEEYTRSGSETVHSSGRAGSRTEEWCTSCVGADSSYCENCNENWDANNLDHCPGCEDDSNVIKKYHAHKGAATPIKSAWTRAQVKPLYFGVELEVEAKTGEDREELATTAAASMGKLLLGIEEDGSLSDGFEIITQPAGLDTHEEYWPNVKLKGCISHETTTCGLHVHASRSAISKLTLGKLLVFVNSDQNREFLETFARRQFSAQYAKKIPDMKLVEGGKRRLQRYEAINTTGHETIEFRFFKGSTVPATIMATLEFCYALIRFCADTAPEDLVVPRFLAFVWDKKMANETSYLRTYLVKRKIAPKDAVAPLPRREPRTRFNPASREW